MEAIYGPVEGECGSAALLEIPATPQAAATVAMWLITAPPYHPFWSQYLLVVLDLNMPGFPPPARLIADSTHELLVLALHPDHEHTPESVNVVVAEGGGLPYLTPENVVEQFIATDDEMRQVAALCARAIVHGRLNPDSDARSTWLPTITRTLGHIRGEAHAS